MAETITYPEGSYGIMPNDAFNKYLRYSNQRRAATGFGATPSDKKAFWEGTMDSVVKNSAQRAAQALENKRYDLSVLNANRNYELSKEQLENQNTASSRQAIGNLAQIPLTYMMYDALGLRKDIPGRKTMFGRFGDWIGEKYDQAFGIPTASAWEVSSDPSYNSDLMYNTDIGIPSYDPGDWWDTSALDLGLDTVRDVGYNMIADTAISSALIEDLFDWSSFADTTALSEFI